MRPLSLAAWSAAMSGSERTASPTHEGATTSVAPPTVIRCCQCNEAMSGLPAGHADASARRDPPALAGADDPSVSGLRSFALQAVAGAAVRTFHLAMLIEIEEDARMARP